MQPLHTSVQETQSDTSKRALTLAMIDDHFPDESWIHVYTDGSATNAIKNGGAGVLIKFPTGETETVKAAAGTHCTNYSAEVQALGLAASMVTNSDSECQQVVFFTDALSVLQVLTADKETELHQVLQEVCRNRKVTLQWVPAYFAASQEMKGQIRW